MATATNDPDAIDAATRRAGDAATTVPRPAHLARNLAGLRHARSLTQDALARAAAVPRSTIANLESGAGNPSLVVLVKVAHALGVPIDELLASPRAKVRRWPAADVAFRVKGRGVTIRDLVPEPVPDEMMEVLDFAPGAAMAGTPHLPGTREFFTCLDGRVNLMVAGERHALADRRRARLPRQPAALVPERRRARAGARRLGRGLRQGRGLRW